MTFVDSMLPRNIFMAVIFPQCSSKNYHGNVNLPVYGYPKHGSNSEEIIHILLDPIFKDKLIIKLIIIYYVYEIIKLTFKRFMMSVDYLSS